MFFHLVFLLMGSICYGADISPGKDNFGNSVECSCVTTEDLEYQALHELFSWMPPHKPGKGSRPVQKCVIHGKGSSPEKIDEEGAEEKEVAKKLGSVADSLPDKGKKCSTNVKMAACCLLQ